MDAAVKRDSLPAPQPTVLIVSRDATFSGTLRKGMLASGFNPIAVSSSFQALQLIADSEIDAVLGDNDLLGTGGLELWDQIRRLHGGKAPPFLLVAQGYDLAVLSRCLESKAAGLVSKGDPIPTLLEQVSWLITDKDKRQAIDLESAPPTINRVLDPLTGVADRDYFERRMIGEWTVANDDNAPFTVLMVAPDNLSEIESLRGRRVAEALLARAAKVIEGELRTRDTVARFDDTTFGVVLARTGRNAGFELAHHLLDTLARTEFGDLDLALQVTFSAGLAVHPHGFLCSPEEISDNALQSCQLATSLGGDRLVHLSQR